MPLLKGGFRLVAQAHNPADFHFEHAVHMSAGPPRFNHALRDDLAHLRHRHQIPRDGRRGWSWGLSWRSHSSRCRSSSLAPVKKSHDVLFRNAPAEPGAVHLRKIYVVLTRNLSHQRRGTSVLALLMRGRCRFLNCRRLRLRRGRFLLFRSCWRWWCGLGRRSRGLSICADDANHCVHLNSSAFCDLNVLKNAGRGRWNFSVDFVSRNFEERLVALDFVSWLLQPFGNRAFDNGLAHLGHDNLSRHSLLPRPVCGDLGLRNPSLYIREIEPLISVLVTMPMLVLFARRRRRNSKGFFPILLNCGRELIEAGEKRSHFPDILLT